MLWASIPHMGTEDPLGCKHRSLKAGGLELSNILEGAGDLVSRL